MRKLLPPNKKLLTRRNALKIGALAAPAIFLPQNALAVKANLLGAASDDPLFNKPYSPQSPFNAKPVHPVLGSTGIPIGPAKPRVANFPIVADLGGSGVCVYHATESDPPYTFSKVNVPDELGQRPVTIPHFPSGVLPPSAGDSEVTIYDATTQLLHSFYGMSLKDGAYSAAVYACESAKGWSFATPSKPYQIRAGGCSPIAGLLRIAEMPIGAKTDTYPQHALAMAIDSGFVLANNASSTWPGPPGPVFPATLQDTGFPYTGIAPAAWPMGTLFMLPATFDVNSMTGPGGKAIARTLMEYGCYLVDTSPGTFELFGEIYGDGAVGFDGGSTQYGLGWMSLFYGKLADYGAIASALRPVLSVDGWLDGDGHPYTPSWATQNLLSMRGPYKRVSGTPAGAFDTASTLYRVPRGSPPFVIDRSIYQPCNPSARGAWLNYADSAGWFVTPTPGRQYKLTCYGDGALSVQFSVNSQDGSVSYLSVERTDPGSIADLHLAKSSLDPL